MKANRISHKATSCFSDLVINYLAGAEDLRPFFRFTADKNGIRQAIEERKRFPVDRDVLVEVIRGQYQDYDLSSSFQKQIESLKSEHTFTVTTAHQPDLMTGYLYFFFKIIHAAKLANYLKEQFPENNFVPVFYIGSEDNDFEELSVFHYGGKTWEWESKQSGAVGRMKTDDLKQLIEELKEALIPPGKHRDELIRVISNAYSGKNTISQAIRYLVHSFLGDLGVLVIDADEERLKRQYLAVMKDELLNSTAYELVQNTSAELKKHYKAQAYVRPINLFYLKDNLRERIEKNEKGWQVLNTDISWQDEKTLTKELEVHPDRFSPNVILRGLYQESILPNVAFIGGGSEVAYWLQLKEAFDYYNVFFPALVLRQSALWMPKAEVDLQEKLGISDEDLFQPLHQLEKEQVLKTSPKDLSLANELTVLNQTFQQIKQKAGDVDSTLNAATEAVTTKIRHLTEGLEKKMIRAEKRHYADRMRQMEKLKATLFPKGTLQERYDNFLKWYLEFGPAFFQRQFEYSRPFGDSFLVIKASDD